MDLKKRLHELMEEMMGMFVARVAVGRLFLFIGQPPIKNEKEGEWEYRVFFTDCVELDEKLFPDVQWSDKEPTKVRLVIDE